MGKVVSREVKNAAKKIVEKYYERLKADFDYNKLLIREVTEIPSKKLRNKVTGYVTRLMKRVAAGTVQGIHIKAHEEEKARMEQFVPTESILDTEKIEVDEVTMRMLEELGIAGPYVLMKAGE